VHPEDFVVNIAGIKAREHIEKQAESERKNFKLVHDLRMLNDENKWIRLIIQDSVLEFDGKGKMWLVMKVLDLAPNQDLESPGRSVLQNTVTNEVVFSMEGERKNICNITQREKEVLQLISKGFPSKLIAEELFISVNTVNNHRKNILKKLNVNNASEAIRQASSLRLI
jgi:DNA-binding CsgD family transcriptional regulator